MMLNYSFIIIFGTIFICTVWGKLVRPAAWSALVFGVVGTIAVLIGNSVGKCSFWGIVTVPITNLCFWIGLPLTLAMPLVRIHRDFLFRKALHLSIVLNIVLLAAVITYWYRNATAYERVRVENMTSHEWMKPREFSVEERASLLQKRPLITKYLETQYPKPFYIIDMFQESGTTTVEIVWLDELFQPPPYTVWLDGNGLTHPCYAETFGRPTVIYDFDSDGRLMPPGTASEMDHRSHRNMGSKFFEIVNKRRKQ